MNGTETFKGRNEVTELVERKLKDLFYEDEVEIVPFGVLKIVDNKESFKKYLNKLEVNEKAASMIVKFAPDYILLKKSEPQELYFLEVKCSVTPCWSLLRTKKIKNRHEGEQIDESNIGEIAREALLSYNRFYPNTIVLYGTPYNKKALMAQFAHNIQCLYCFKNEGEYDCLQCPSKNNGFFTLERNEHSSGSQTPNTNINLDTFVSAKDFFSQIGINMKQEVVEAVIGDICNYNVRFPSDVKFHIERYIRNILVDQGCTWVSRLDGDYYWTPTNDFYHSTQDCFTLKNTTDILAGEEQEAIQNGKRRCKFCK